MAEEKKDYQYERVSYWYDGKKYTFRGKTLAEAHKKAAQKRVALERGEADKLDSTMQVKKWAAVWLETYKKPNVTAKTYQGLEHRMNDIILPEIGNLRLKDVKNTHLQKVLNSRAGFSESHVSKVRNLMCGMFQRAAIERLIPYDPSAGLIMPKTTSGSYRSITPEERQHILKVAESHVAGVWVKTMLYCGLRPGETAALRWVDIDFKKNKINIHQALESGSDEIKTPKTSAGVRSVPIPKALQIDLKKAKEGKSPYDFVFTQQKSGKMHTHSSLRCYWGSFKRALDLEMGAKTYRNQIILSLVAPDLVPYCLRHTYGTDLQDAGVAINVAKYLMGHEDISTTGNIYTDTTEYSIANAVKALDILHGVNDGVKKEIIS